MARLKYNIKPNQSSVGKAPQYNSKKIKGIVIDVSKKSIYEIQIENTVDAFQKKLDFFNFEMKYLPNNEVLVYGTDEITGNNHFEVLGLDKKIFQNSIVIQYKYKGLEDSFKSTQETIDSIAQLIQF